MKRQFILKIQDKTALSISWLRSLVIGVVLATLYVNLPETTGSAFGKGGLMFISLLFNAFQAFSELPAVRLNSHLTRIVANILREGNAGQRSGEQTQSIRLLPAFCPVDCGALRGPSLLRAADLGLLLDRVLYNASFPVGRGLFHLLPHDFIWKGLLLRSTHNFSVCCID